jgi:hypothetical protein
MSEFRESLRARLDAILDQACSSLVNGGDHDTRKYVAERLAEAARNGITHLEELSVVARRALLEISKRKASLRGFRLGIVGHAYWAARGIGSDRHGPPAFFECAGGPLEARQRGRDDREHTPS